MLAKSRRGRPIAKSGICSRGPIASCQVSKLAVPHALECDAGVLAIMCLGGCVNRRWRRVGCSEIYREKGMCQIIKHHRPTKLSSTSELSHVVACAILLLLRAGRAIPPSRTLCCCQGQYPPYSPATITGQLPRGCKKATLHWRPKTLSSAPREHVASLRRKDRKTTLFAFTLPFPYL